MKSYANFLLLENLLYNISSTVPSIKALAESIFNPRIAVVEEDCEPNIATRMSINAVLTTPWATPIGTTRYMYEYLLDVYGDFLDPVELSALLAAGEETEVMVRHSGSCNSTGGICRVCLYANMIASTANVVDPSTGTVLTRYYDDPPEFETEVQVPAVGQYGYLAGSLGKVKPFFQPSQRAYFAWVANTYTGSLLGVNAYDNFPLPVKNSTARDLINDNLLSSAAGELSRISNVPSNYIDYVDKLEDKLEKAMSIIVLYCVYGGLSFTAFPSSFPRARDLYGPI